MRKNKRFTPHHNNQNIIFSACFVSNFSGSNRCRYISKRFTFIWKLENQNFPGIQQRVQRLFNIDVLPQATTFNNISRSFGARPAPSVWVWSSNPGMSGSKSTVENKSLRLIFYDPKNSAMQYTAHCGMRPWIFVVFHNYTTFILCLI